MFWVNVKRIFRSGFINFWRNRVVSLASVLIMTVTLLFIAGLIFMGALLDTTLDQLNNKVDINIYFTTEASEDNIFLLRQSIEALPEVASVSYLSREEALAQFRDRHANDYLTLQALDELGDNPLGAVLSIKAKETSQYEGIAKFLEDQNALSSSEDPIIDKVNYYQNKASIERLAAIIDGAERAGFATTIFLSIVSIIITFNTIRLAIYTAREEIGVMRLVGADNTYIRGPFLVEGTMYGGFAGIITLFISYLSLLYVGGKTESFFGGLNLLDYFVGNFGQIFVIVMASGMLLGIISSYLAVRRYLQI